MNKEKILAKIYEQIETVYDPEIPVNINELGLIYKVEIDDEGDNSDYRCIKENEDNCVMEEAAIKKRNCEQYIAPQ